MYFITNINKNILNIILNFALSNFKKQKTT